MVCHTSLVFFAVVFKILLAVRIFYLPKKWRYLITVWFELLFRTFFCFWIIFFAEAFVQFVFVSYRTGQSRIHPWFSFILRFWMFYMEQACLSRSLFKILRKWTRTSLGSELTLASSALNLSLSKFLYHLCLFIVLDDFSGKFKSLIKNWIK